MNAVRQNTCAFHDMINTRSSVGLSRTALPHPGDRTQKTGSVSELYAPLLRLVSDYHLPEYVFVWLAVGSGNASGDQRRICQPRRAAPAPGFPSTEPAPY